MSHLHIERLAALADEQPTTDERNHLAQCIACARELEAHRSLVAIAGGEREALALPLTRWETLSPRLKEEGLIASERRLPAARTILQAAAAIVLIASGAVIGRASAGASPVPGGLTGAEPVAVAASLDSAPTSFASVEEAQRWKSFYAAGYQNAVTFLATNDSAKPSETPAVMRARLSALDRVSRTMREALNDAPYDPVINDFYLNSFGQREATIRQLNSVLPQSVRLTGF